ncbi:uncharacterized protein [Dermacentor albipictus]|uniref:uncharacterized protein n=1 Tax=Dermacentor albipictus TaxID=60249 RepID=UPI0038FC1E25
MTCCAFACQYSFSKGKNMFAIPSGKRNGLRRKTWLHQIGRENFRPTSSARLCDPGAEGQGRVTRQRRRRRRMEPEWERRAELLTDLESSEYPLSESEDCTSHSSSDDGAENLLTLYEEDDDKRCVQAAVIVTFVTCLSVILVLIVLDSVDAKLPQNSTYQRANSGANAFTRRRYEPGKRSESFLICTLGGEATDRRLYPPDGLCNWIVYTHVGHNAQNRSLAPAHPGSWPSWSFFLRLRSQYSATRLMPSLSWRNITGLETRRALSLNRTLTALGMGGLALLNVRIGVDQVAALAELLATLASVNPGMFLALGASFERLNDRTASGLLPAALLDRLVTPLGLFVLETHQPEPGGDCRTSFSTAQQPVYGDQGQRLTFRGAHSFMAQPALRYTSPAALARCVSIMAGALVFHVPDGERPVLGAPCSHWSLARLESVCRLASVRANVEARAMYGHTAHTFFSFESSEHLWTKVFSTLQSMLWAEMPTCLAVYALDLDATPGLCFMDQERPNRLVYTAYDILKLLKNDSILG